MAAVCRFNDETNSARRQLSYAAKQIIAKEVEIERMRRVERVMTEKASLQQVALNLFVLFISLKARIEIRLTLRKPSVVHYCLSCLLTFNVFDLPVFFLFFYFQIRNIYYCENVMQLILTLKLFDLF